MSTAGFRWKEALPGNKSQIGTLCEKWSSSVRADPAPQTPEFLLVLLGLLLHCEPHFRLNSSCLKFQLDPRASCPISKHSLHTASGRNRSAFCTWNEKEGPFKAQWTEKENVDSEVHRNELPLLLTQNKCLLSVFLIPTSAVGNKTQQRTAGLEMHGNKLHI